VHTLAPGPLAATTACSLQAPQADFPADPLAARALGCMISSPFLVLVREGVLNCLWATGVGLGRLRDHKAWGFPDALNNNNAG
jgi:hypothetical protein